MTERARQRLLDALDACETIVSFVQDKTLDDYEGDVQLQLATERLLTIIGEACNQAVRAQPDLGSRIPELQKVMACGIALFMDTILLMTRSLGRP